MFKSLEPQLSLPPLQESMLLQSARHPGQGVYLQQLVIRITRPLQSETLRRAFDLLLARHAAMRVAFVFNEAARAVSQLQAQATMPLREEDLSLRPPNEQAARLEEFLQEDRAREFALDELPLMRVMLFKMAEGNHCLVWTSHHAILDGRSRVILLQELWALEAALNSGKTPALEPPPDYANYLGWRQRQSPSESCTFWQSQLEGMVTASQLPRSISPAAHSWGCSALHLDETTTTRLRQLTQSAGVTMNTFMQAAWAIFLGRHSGSEDVLFGATRACRHLEGINTQGLVGLLINTVPIRAKPQRDLLLRDFLRDLQQQWLTLREHEHVPLERIHEWCNFNPASPLFHSIVVFERGVLHDLVSPGDASWTCELQQRTGVPLMLSAFDGKSLRLELHHDGAGYGAEDGEHFLGILQQLIFSMLEGLDRPLRELSLLSPQERLRVVVTWNQTSTAYPSQTRVEEMFALQARHTPQATALIHQDTRISYEALNAQAEALCARFVGEGLEPGHRVAVALERSPNLIIAMLAILKAGCAYVPMEINAASSRAQAILRQVRPKFLLLHGAENIHWIKESADLKLIDLATNIGVAQPLPQGDFTGRVHDAAYVMFTSGSTGVPKGVIVPHRAIVRLVKDTNYCKISSEDVIGHLSNPAFDASTFEVWGPLLNGGAVSIIDSEVALSPTELRGKIATDRITALWLTTALFNEFACEQPDTFRGLRYLLTGGEKVSPTAFAAVAQACPQLQLINGYGPTETTTFATTFHYDPNQSMRDSIPIGRPIANTTIYLLDERGEPVPLGVPGEIHIGGPGVALGYFDDPALTRQRFLPDPFDPGPKRLLYRSGDVGRLLLDGSIEFLGRVDQQLKLRGFRIEPAEIENALTALEVISASAVLGRFEQGTCVGLSAFVTLHRPATAREDQKIAARLTASLPSYMVPDCITILDRLPVTANGKVDRAALAELAVKAAPTKPPLDFQLTKTQSVLRDIWRELLERDAIGLDENFFALGGHSLRAVRCLLQVHRKLGVSLPLITLFESPTIRGLAAQIETATTPQSALSPATADRAVRDEARPTTPAEQRFLDHLSNRAHPEDMIISQGFRFRGPLRTDLLEQSLALVVRRHAPLRTKFIQQQGRTMARAIPAPDFPLPIFDLTHLKPAEQEALGQEAQLENSRQLFYLATDLPLRVRMLKFSAEDHLLLLALHHIVADGWSLDLLRRDLFKAYQALLAGQADPLPPLPVTFGMIAEQERNRAPEAFNHRIALWQQRLALPLPSIDTLFRKQPAELDPTEDPFPGATLLLSAEQSQAIAALARAHQTSVFMVLLSVYKLLLSRLTANQDVMVGTMVAGRIAPGAADVIGTFAHNRPLRTDLTGCARFEQILQRVGTTMREALKDEDLPFGSIAALVPPRVPPRSNPIFDTIFNHYSDDPEANQSPPGLSISLLENPIRHTKVALTFNSFLRGERLELVLCALVKFFSQEQIERLRDEFVCLLQQILERPDRKLEEYVLVGPETPRADSPTPVAPPTPTNTESVLQEIWEGIFSTRPIALADNFFALGGHSIRAVRCMLQIQRRLGISLPMVTLFEAPTIRELAARLDASQAPRTVAREGPPEGGESTDRIRPATGVEQFIWNYQLRCEHPQILNLSRGIRITGPLRPDVLQESFRQMRRRHPLLRTRFSDSPDGLTAEVIPSPEFLLQCEDRPHLSPAERVSQGRAAFIENTCRPFDLGVDLPLRVRLLQFDAFDCILLIAVHSIVADGWSLAILCRDLFLTYESLVSGQPNPLPALQLTHEVIAAGRRHRSPAGLERQLENWKKRLALPLPSLDVVFRKDSATIRMTEPPFLAANATLTSARTQALESLAKKQECTLFLLLLSIYALLLSRLTAHEDVIVGTTLAGPNDPGSEDLIGTFIRLIPLRTNLERCVRFDQVIDRIKTTAIKTFEREVPLVSRIASLVPGRIPPRGNPVFDTAFNHYAADEFHVVCPSGLQITVLENPDPNAELPLGFYSLLKNGQISLRLCAQSKYFSQSQIDEMLRQFVHLLEQILDAPAQPLEQYSLLTPQARTLLANPSTVLSVPEYATVMSMVEKHLTQRSDATAVTCEGQVLSYGGLDLASNRLAHHLLNSGLKRGETVAVHIAACLALPACVLAIFKAGGVLLLVDPSLPVIRQRLILQEGRTRFLLELADSEPSALADGDYLRLELDPAPSEWNAGAAKNLPPPALRAQDPACIFFTSGTTGVPNAVVFSHQGLSHFITWQRTQFGISHDARVAQMTRPSFDVILRDLFLPLTSGGVCCIPNERLEEHPGRVLEWLGTAAITVLHTVPARAQNWLSDVAEDAAISLPALSYLFFSGEPLHETHVNAWRRVAPNAKIINLYGPTETTLVKTFHEVPTPAPAGVQSLGRALPQSQVLVLNHQLQLCGISEPGQVVIRTPFRSLGYLNAPELQQQRFIRNPHGNDPEDLLYVTGDVGKFDTRGNIEYLGRRDHQLKINGVRVEPDEIGSVISSLAGILSCYVLAAPGPDKTPALIAFVVPAPGVLLEASALRSKLVDLLPAAQVPSRIRLLKSLPINPNGKVDARALLTLLDDEVAPPGALPASSLELLIAQSFSFVLNQEPIHRNDDFFELGGHSLLAMRLVARLSEQLDQSVSIRQLLMNTTPAALAAALEIGANNQTGNQSGDEAVMAYDPDATVHALFSAQAGRTPAAVAAIDDNGSLTFAQLDALSNQLAATLIKHGVRVEQRVALVTTRSLEMLVGLLGILKTGAAYVPIDPRDPTERVHYLVENCRASVVVASPASAEAIPPGSYKIIKLNATLRDQPDSSVPPGVILPIVSPHHACYIIYTSGSTGKPKGVVVEHRQVIAYHNAMAARTGWQGTGRVALLQPLAVDSTVTLLFPPLFGGGTLRLISETTALDPAVLAKAFAATPIDLLKIAPSHLEALLASTFVTEILPRQFLVLGGEVASAQLLAKLRELNAPCRIFNHYGPTETTVGVSTFEITDWRSTEVPLSIGRPLAHARFYLLDGNFNSVASGQSGELYVGGSAVTRGYTDSPALTAGAFLPDPFSTVPGARMYRTGDRARALPDGNMEFLGRSDHQIKIRGRRIDPREIEVVLETYPHVKRAVVMLTEPLVIPVLTAFVVTDEPESLIVDDLRKFLELYLPTAVIPARFVPLHELPRTGHGKIDLQRLAQMEEPIAQAAPTNAVRLENQSVAQRLATVWQGLLGIQTIDFAKDFFELGGHSLLATRLAGLIYQHFGIHLSLQKILSDSTLEGMAGNILHQLTATLPVTPVTSGSMPPTVSQEFPLLPTQEGMWFLEHVQESDHPAYHINYIWRLHGPLHRRALEASWNQLVQRHEALRSIFPARSGRPCQVIQSFVPFSIPVFGVRGEDSASRESTAMQRANEYLRTPLDPATGPLLRMALIAVDDEQHLFVFSAHHLITDGWSMGVLYRELEMLYSANIKNSGQSLPALSQSYADHVLQQTDYYRTQAYRMRLTEWCQHFRTTVNAISIPTDFPRQALQTFRGKTLRRQLTPQLRERLSGLSKMERATPNMLFLAGLYILLHQWTGNERVVVGSAIAARMSHHVEQMVGCLINTILNRGDVSGHPSFRDVIQRSRTTFMEALSRQDIPLSDIVRFLGGTRNADRSPLFQVSFTYQNSSLGSRFTLEGVTSEMRLPERVAAKFDLSFSVLENQDLPALALSYNQDLFRQETAEAILSQFVRVLEIASLNPDTPMADLFPPTPAPAAHVTCPFPQDIGLHNLIEAQVDRTPRALAVAMGEEQLTYAQLDRASNALAHRLLELGVDPESIVAVYLTRSVEAIVTLVGILKAGAAYLPLDLADPPARLAHALKDSNARILITEHAMAERIPYGGLTTLWIDDAWQSLCQSSASRPHVKVSPKSLACLFYTSGSTGTPKGVAVQHDNLINFAVTFAQRHQLESTDRVAQLTALSFDVSGEELWPTLIAGSSVHVGCEALKAMPEKLLVWLNLRAITICNLATPLAEVTMDDQMHRAKTLRLLITGGDRLRKWPQHPLLCNFINSYGPTETTIFSTNAELSHNPQDGAMPPIGRALENQRVHLLDAEFQPVAEGSPGEIFIGGAGVTRGYFRNPAATADKFIPDPFSGQPGARLYRTGDLARLRPDGQLDFIGRIDHQVQIRGFRVELGEIEAALAAHPDVSLGAVTIQGDDAATPVIIAHAVLKAGANLGFIPLREYLSQRLPGHMIPSRLALHEQFPLTPSGKILRSALPAVDLSQRHVDADYVQPASATEQAVARFFGELFGSASIGLDDDFFDLGGHSLLIIQLLSHLKERYGLDLPIEKFYTHATVRGLASQVDAQPPPIVKASPEPISYDDPLRKIERRPLLALLATRKLPPVDAAFIGYFQSSLYASTGLTKRQVVEEWYDGMPTFRTLRQTFLGTTGGIFLPRFENDLYEEPARLVEQLVECLELAGSIGARFVSLTGLIPSATAYGESLAAAIGGRQDLPQVTTGHATTGCTVALSLKHLLEASGRDLGQERLGFLGLGSIGLTSLELILEVLPHPAEILLCDVFMKRPLMEATSRKLREELGFKGRIEIIEAKAGAVPEAFYRARTIVGATNVPGILQVKSLLPGTAIVDDSAPHCFDSEDAMARIREQGDLLVTEGGLVRLPEAAPVILYRPEFIEIALRSARLDQPFHAHEITGCVLSALLNAADPSLPVTIGRVSLEASRRHYRKLEELGFQPADLRCLGQTIDDQIIASFKKRFGQPRD